MRGGTTTCWLGRVIHLANTILFYGLCHIGNAFRPLIGLETPLFRLRLQPKRASYGEFLMLHCFRWRLFAPVRNIAQVCRFLLPYKLDTAGVRCSQYRSV
jgi:hypothetical protein